jgi:hypothetical protein
MDGKQEMHQPSISGQERRGQARLVGWRHWRRQVVAGMRWATTLALLSDSPAMAAPTILDFEDIEAGTTITTQYSDRGVVFMNHYLDTDSAAPSGTRVLRTIPLGTETFDPIPLIMTFGFPQSRVKLLAMSEDVALDGTLIALDAFGQEVARDGPKPVAANVFTTVFEVTDPDAKPRIMQAELRLERGVNFAIDDLEFESASAGKGCQDESPTIVEIREADPDVDRPQHDCMRRCLANAVRRSNTTILLGPTVFLDFDGADEEIEIPLDFGRCVTLTSASAFPADGATPRLSCEDILSPQEREDLCPGAGLDAAALPSTPAPQSNLAGSAIDVQPARTPQSFGPLLKYGPHRENDKVFLSIGCGAGDLEPSDHVRISGFRIRGPSLGHQEHENFGIRIDRCLDIEISNMEIFGWGGDGVTVLDEGDADNQPEEGPGQVPPNNFPGERIGQPDQVRIFGNFIHHNQHPRSVLNSHTAGYGVEVDHGAWAQIYENVFDFNRHAIATPGDVGGYEASRNLVLKGGGYHGLGFHTHQFDIHGTESRGKGGQAGVFSVFAENSFQYLSGAALYIRGRPQGRLQDDGNVLGAVIRDNIFAHEGLEDDPGDDAIKVYDRDDLDVIQLGPNNDKGFDPYGRYGVCDFDADGIDDLFLATGRTWWFSSFGEFPWSYLSARPERLNQVRLGYFDDDKRCDVLTEKDGEWLIASGGTGSWQSIGAFGAPLSQVVFGRFDPSIRDHRPGVTRRTTHAFWRKESGEWLVTPLSAPTGWQHAQSSGKPLSELRFGDFTGDGVTDVLAVENGRWSISESAHGSWQRLNPYLSNDVRYLLIADLDHNNIADLIRLESVALDHNNIDNLIRLESVACDTVATFSIRCRPLGRVTWWVSDDGRSRWRKLKTYTITSADLSPVDSVFGYAGRFGAAPGGGVLLIDSSRTGRFFSEAEIAAGASPDWTSVFAY